MADRYLVATGNWNSTSVWSASSGGASGASVPGSSDNVYLNAASGDVTLTINVASTCLDFDCTGFIGTLTGTGSFTVRRDLTFVPEMTVTYNGDVTLPGAEVASIKAVGKTIGKSLTLSKFSNITVFLGSDIAIAGSITRTGGDFVAGPYTVTLNGTGVQTITGAFTGARSFGNLAWRPAASVTGNELRIASNITIENSLVIENSTTAAEKRLLVASDIRGTSRTLTAKTVTASYCDFEDITGAGLAGWDLSAATGGSGNCGGNSGITFTTPATNYMVGSSNRNFSANTWANSSGGTIETGRPPLPQDTAILDANTGSGTVTMDLQRVGTINAVDFVGTFDPSHATYCYGSMLLGEDLTLGQNVVLWRLAGRGTHTVSCGGKSWAKQIRIEAITGSYSLQDDFISSSQLDLLTGTFNANNFNVTCNDFYSTNSNVRTITMGSGTWTLTGDSSIWNTSLTTNLTFNKDTALIKLTGTLTANRTCDFGALTLYNLENATSGNYALIIKGAPTFNQVKVNPGRIQRFYRSQTVTASTWILEGTAANPIVLSSDTTTAAVVAKAGGGTVTAKYATISNLTATPTNTFYAENSINGGNTTNWIFITDGFSGKVLGVVSPVSCLGVIDFLKVNNIS
jgi:hypothetical protein